MKFKAVDRTKEGDTLLRQCQLKELYLLEVFKEICEKHNLRYFLAYGTLLGALRHGGPIPWDDDVDVIMPWPDYKKFCAIAPRELPEYLMVQTPKLCPGCFNYFAKLRDRRTCFIEWHSPAQHPSGIYIDIFPFERIPKLPLKLRLLIAGAISYGWRKSRKHRTMYHGTCLSVFVSAFSALFFSTLHVVSRWFFNFLSCVIPTAWGLNPETGSGGVRRLFDDDVLFPLVKVCYEGREFNAPHDSESVLAKEYGDWRTPPPEHARVSKHSRLMLANVDAPIPSKWSWPEGGFRE